MMVYIAAVMVAAQGLMAFALPWLAKDIPWQRTNSFGYVIMDRDYSARSPLITLHVISVAVIVLLLLDTTPSFALATAIWLLAWGFWLKAYGKLWPLSGEERNKAVMVSLLMTFPVVTLIGAIPAILA